MNGDWTVAGGRGRRTWWRPESTTLLSLYIALLIGIPAPLVFGPIGAAGTMANVVAAAAVSFWVAGRITPRLGLAVGRQPIRPLIYFFALSTLCSYVVAATIPLAELEATGADRGLIILVCWSGIALLAADGIRDRYRLDVLLRRLVLFGALLGLLGVIQFFTGFDIASYIRIPGLTLNEALETVQVRYGVRRVAGTATHPIELGVVLALVFPLCLHYAIHARVGRRLFQWSQTSLIGLGALMSVSRSAVLGLLIAGAATFLGWPSQYRRRAVLLAPLLIPLLPIVAPGVIGTIRGLFSDVGSDPSVTSRTDDYALVTPFIADHPVFGRGFGAFIPHLYVLPGGRSGGNLILDNEYLSTLIQKGVVGVIALLALLVGAFFAARSARKAATDQETRDLAQSLAAAVLVPVATFATFDGLSFPMSAGTTFLTIGAIGALWRTTRTTGGLPKREDDNQAPSLTRRRATGLPLE